MAGLRDSSNRVEMRLVAMPVNQMAVSSGDEGEGMKMRQRKSLSRTHRVAVRNRNIDTGLENCSHHL